MPARNQDETFVLKHRLTGAAVLIAFAVIVLPLLLGAPEEGKVGQAPGSSGEAGGSDTTVFHSSITPISGVTPNARLKSSGQGDAAKNEATESGTKPHGMQTASAKDTAKQAVKAPVAEKAGKQARSKPQAKAAPQSEDQGGSQTRIKESGSQAGAATKTKKSIERGWIVQVGVFKNPDNVKKLVAKLEGDGIDSSTTGVDTSEGKATRVWVGPFETRVEAARTQARIKHHTGSEGLIVAYP